MDDSIGRNREHWDAAAPKWADAGRRSWAQEEPAWGIWGVPESQLGILEGVAGADAVELGCGTAYVSAWMARRGARPIGVDPTPAQLGTAQALQREFDLRFPLVEAAGEHCVCALVGPAPASGTRRADANSNEVNFFDSAPCGRRASSGRPGCRLDQSTCRYCPWKLSGGQTWAGAGTY